MKGILSEVEKFYIQNHQNLTPEELSKILGKGTQGIKKELTRLKKKANQSKLKEAGKIDSQLVVPEPPKEETATRAAFGRNKKYGATVMTPQASELSDETRKQRRKMPEKIQRSIFKPFNE